MKLLEVLGTMVVSSEVTVVAKEYEVIQAVVYGCIVKVMGLEITSGAAILTHLISSLYLFSYGYPFRASIKLFSFDIAEPMRSKASQTLGQFVFANRPPVLSAIGTVYWFFRNWHCTTLSRQRLFHRSWSANQVQRGKLWNCKHLGAI